MNEIFNKINPNENWLLTQMNKTDLKEFLFLVNGYFLEYRKTLEIDKNLTFGLEIECDKLNLRTARRIINRKNQEFFNTENSWQIASDVSIPKGCEIISPIFKDNIFSWQQLFEICKTLQRYAKIKKQAAAHIHIGANIINNDVQKLWQFLQLWMTYEAIIYRFGYGEYLTARPYIQSYALPISNIIRSRYKFFYNLVEQQASIDEFFYYLFLLLHRQPHNHTGRNEALNFNNVSDFCSSQISNTIEFRCPNGTLNPIIWQNNVNLFACMLTNTKLFNQDLILQRLEKNKRQYQELIWYQEIYLNPALEFCDLVFTRNIDKVYFLRQYLKNFEVAKPTKKILQKAQCFTVK